MSNPFLYIHFAKIASIIIIAIIMTRILYSKNIQNIKELYENVTANPETTKLEPIDRTRLYGSIFLDNLDTQITNLTDPPIKYDTKRMQLFRYDDVLR